MADSYFVRLQSGSFVGPTTLREIQDAYAAGKLRWDLAVFAAEGVSPNLTRSSVPLGDVASLLGPAGPIAGAPPGSGSPYASRQFQALDTYATVLSALGWVLIALAVIAGVAALLYEGASAGGIGQVLAAAAIAVLGLGVVATGQLLQCIRAIHADVRMIALHVSAHGSGETAAV